MLSGKKSFSIEKASNDTLRIVKSDSLSEENVKWYKANDAITPHYYPILNGEGVAVYYFKLLQMQIW